MLATGVQTEIATLRFGINPWLQATTWHELEATGRLTESCGYDHLWTLDHIYPTLGPHTQPMLEGWTTLAALAVRTERVRLGVLVSATTLRHPALLAKMAATVDQISGGRLVVGLGAGWAEREHRDHGIDLGTPGERSDRLEEAAQIVRELLHGETVTVTGKYYRVSGVRHEPLPLQKRIPILIGAAGERKTLRTVARHADIWNVDGPVEVLERKDAALRAHCAELGRDHRQIERTYTVQMVIRDTVDDAAREWGKKLEHNRNTPADADRRPWLGPPSEMVARILPYYELGFHTLIVELPAPHDRETIERLITEVRPAVEARLNVSPRRRT